MKTSFSLAGRIVLVTGASSGLGARFARLCALNGARVVLGARRVNRILDIQNELVEQGQSALAVPLDVTDEGSITAAYDAPENAFGVVDTIIANAGVVAPGRSTKVDGDAVKTVIETNLTGVHLTLRNGAHRLIAQGCRSRETGRIVIIDIDDGQSL